MWSMCAAEYHSALGKNETLLCVTAPVHPEGLWEVK